jgi:hypothetical protein
MDPRRCGRGKETHQNLIPPIDGTRETIVKAISLRRMSVPPLIADVLSIEDLNPLPTNRQEDVENGHVLRWDLIPLEPRREVESSRTGGGEFLAGLMAWDSRSVVDLDPLRECVDLLGKNIHLANCHAQRHHVSTAVEDDDVEFKNAVPEVEASFTCVLCELIVSDVHHQCCSITEPAALRWVDLRVRLGESAKRNEALPLLFGQAVPDEEEGPVPEHITNSFAVSHGVNRIDEGLAVPIVCSPSPILPFQSPYSFAIRKSSRVHKVVWLLRIVAFDKNAVGEAFIIQFEFGEVDPPQHQEDPEKVGRVHQHRQIMSGWWTQKAERRRF